MTPTSTFLRPLVTALLLATLATPALAEKADREKPINLEADRMSMDDINKVQVYEGNVILTQGTLQIRTAKLVVTQDADGFQKGVATSGENGANHMVIDCSVMKPTATSHGIPCRRSRK